MAPAEVETYILGRKQIDRVENGGLRTFNAGDVEVIVDCEEVKPTVDFEGKDFSLELRGSEDNAKLKFIANFNQGTGHAWILNEGESIVITKKDKSHSVRVTQKP